MDGFGVRDLTSAGLLDSGGFLNLPNAVVN